MEAGVNIKGGRAVQGLTALFAKSVTATKIVRCGINLPGSTI